MNTRSVLLLAMLLGVSTLVDHGTTSAGELKVFSAVGMRHVMLDLGPAFERATGHTLSTTFDAAGLIVKRIEAGETADVVIVPRAALERLIQARQVSSSTAADLASSVAAVAVKQGAPRPDISSVDAFKQTLLKARAIARSDPGMGGASGVHVANVIERLGIADTVKAKSLLANRPGDTPGTFVADGRADIALHQLQELMAIPGIDIVGPFPAELQETFVFAAGVTSTAKDGDAARALVAFLRTPEAKAVIKSKGMQPAQ